MTSLVQTDSENAQGTRRQKAFKGAMALGALTSNNTDEISLLLHTVCDKMTTPVVADMKNFPLVVGGAYAEEVVESVTYFFSNAVSSGFSSEELEADLKKGEMPEAMLERFSEVYQMRRGELETAAQKKSEEISYAYLKDFDWSIRQIFGTNKLSKTRKTVLLLTLTVAQVSGEEITRTFELDQTQLDNMIEEFEKIAKASRKLIVP